MWARKTVAALVAFAWVLSSPGQPSAPSDPVAGVQSAKPAKPGKPKEKARKPERVRKEYPRPKPRGG